MRLMRELRCFPEVVTGHSTILNTWAGSTNSNAVGAFWVLRAVVEGRVDERTGYLCSIETLDRLLRDVVLPCLCDRVGQSSAFPVIARALLHAFPVAAEHCPKVAHLRELQWGVSPFVRFTVEREDMSMIQVTEAFEFSAAHRLHCSDLSEEENRRIFGKCSNPNGHGHNYVVEVTVAGRTDDRPGAAVELPAVRRTVNERVITRFDHRHLNRDCVEFESLNPSVENIARVIWGLLRDAFSQCRLSSVRVWETPKTYAEYNGE
ncbi:MAG: 6-pyruvoyl tetrahydropterin synthase family protein [Phycisphaerae bacterium]